MLSKKLIAAVAVAVVAAGGTAVTQAANGAQPKRPAAATEKLSASKNALAFNVKKLHAKHGKITLKMANPSSFPHAIAVRASHKRQDGRQGRHLDHHGDPQEGQVHVLLPRPRPPRRRHEGHAHRQLTRSRRGRARAAPASRLQPAGGWSMRTRLPDGSRTAKSRAPQGWSVGSCTISAPAARTFSNVASRSSVWKWTPFSAPLATQGGERVAVGRAAVEVVREDDRDAGLGGGADGDPAEVVAGDVVAQLEAERVAVEGQREVRVVDEDEARGKREVHARNARERAPRALLRSCSACGSGG